MQLNTTLLNDYCKIYAADPEYSDVDALAAYVRVHRTELMQELHQYGILLFRGLNYNVIMNSMSSSNIIFSLNLGIHLRLKTRLVCLFHA